MARKCGFRSAVPAWAADSTFAARCLREQARSAGARHDYARRRAELFLDARNLTNKKAVADLSAVIAATPQSAIYYPVDGRALYGGVKITF